MIPTLEWLPEGVRFIDQTKLPFEETYVLATDYKQVATVINDMIVRGAMAVAVFADESRPFNQGARLTAWELVKDTMPATLIRDNMAGYFMSKGRIHGVI